MNVNRCVNENRFHIRARGVLRNGLAGRAAALLLLAAGPAYGGGYQDGSKINLSTIRGSIATASFTNSPSWGGPRAPLIPIQNSYHHGGPTNSTRPTLWWQVKFPETYQVDNYRIDFMSWAICTAFRIQTSLNGTDWSDRDTVVGNAGATVTRTFPGGAAEARFVRLWVDAYANAGHGLVLAHARFYGPNDPALDPRISVAQSTWNGGSATLLDPYYNRANPTVPSASPEIVGDVLAGALGAGIQYFPNAYSQQQTNEIVLATSLPADRKVPPEMSSEL